MSKSSKTNKDIKEEKKQVKKIKKETKDYLLLRKKAITIGIICISIVVIELIVMLIMHLVRESKITYIDALYHIENVDILIILQQDLVILNIVVIIIHFYMNIQAKKIKIMFKTFMLKKLN